MTTIGTEFHAAALFNEYERHSREKAKLIVIEAFERAAEENRCTFHPISWQEGIDQEQGPMMIGEARVKSVIPEPMRIVDDLSFGDLQMLRAVTRRVHQQYNPGKTLTDQECDAYIDQIAPETLERMLKEQVDSGRIN